jgi:hypothetical protein
MTLSTALVTDDYEKLRGTAVTLPSYSGAMRASVLPISIVAAGTVSTTPSGFSFGSVAVTVTSGSLSDVRADMRVLFSKSNNMYAAYLDIYVRVAGAASPLKIGESSRSVAPGDHWWVLDDYPLFERLARDVGGTHLTDYEQTFRQVLPRITGLDSVYVRKGSTATISFSPTLAAGTSGGAAPTPLWDIVDGSFDVGNSGTAAITATFPAGWRWIHLTGTESSRALTRHILVIVEPEDGTSDTIANGFTGASLTNTLGQGISGTIGVFDGAGSLLPDTLIVLWYDDENYSGSAGSFRTGENIAFYGRLRRKTAVSQTDPLYSQFGDIQYQLSGIGSQYAALGGVGLAFVNDSTPTSWSLGHEINDLTPYRAAYVYITEYSSLANLCDVQFDAYDNTFETDDFGAQGGNALAMLEDIVKGVNASIEFAAGGKVFIGRQARYMNSRGSLATIAAWDNRDYIGELSVTVDPVRSTGRVKAGGGCYLPSSDYVSDHYSVAPGEAPDRGSGRTELNGQVLIAGQNTIDAQDELNKRAGHHLEASNPTDIINCTHPDGYAFLVPSRCDRYTWALTEADTSIEGLNYTTSIYWQLTSLTINHDNEAGARAVAATYERETDGESLGSRGKTVTPQPEANNGLPSYEDPSDIYVLPYEPIDGGIESYTLAKGTGNMALINEDGYLYRTEDWSTLADAGGPTWDRVSLGISDAPVEFIGDPQSPKYLGTGTEVNGWFITDGVDAIYYIEDVFGITPTVTLQKTLAGAVDAIPRNKTRSIECSFAFANKLVVVSYYGTLSSFNGVWYTYSTNGTTWSTETQITSHYSNENNPRPPVYVSNKTSGAALTGAFSATGSTSTAEARFYTLTSNFATATQITSPTNFEPE